MRPMAAAAIGALIAGVAMYAVGARANQESLVHVPAFVQTTDGRLIEVPNARAVGYAPIDVASALQPAVQPVVLGQTPARRRTVYASAPTRERVVYTSPVQERVVTRPVQQVIVDE